VPLQPVEEATTTAITAPMMKMIPSVMVIAV